MQSDFSNWSQSLLIHQSVLWCISPSFARQAILRALSSWVESPTTSCHIFLVPRILQRDFGRLSKFVLFSGQYIDLPLPFTPLVPFVLYYLPPFDHSAVYQQQLQQQSVDKASNRVPSWIQKEIDGLLRVSAPSWYGGTLPPLFVCSQRVWYNFLFQNPIISSLSSHVSWRLHQSRTSFSQPPLWEGYSWITISTMCH